MHRLNLVSDRLRVHNVVKITELPLDDARSHSVVTVGSDTNKVVGEPRVPVGLSV